MTMRSSFLGPKAASMMEHDRFIIDVANIAAELRAVRLVEVVPISFRGNESSQEELVVVQVELQHRLPETVVVCPLPPGTKEIESIPTR